jgi:hypothetical protein
VKIEIASLLSKSSKGKNELLFVNRLGRPFSANKLREKQLHHEVGGVNP